MTTDLYTALAKANETITNPSKDGKGNYGTYLTLDALLDHVRKPLAAHGLSIVQDVILEGDRVQVVTQLLHASGESLVFGPLTGPAGANWQQLGGAVSYARRYALLAALGIAGGDDDDAQAHTDANPAVSHPGPTPNPRNLNGPAARNLTAAATPKQVGMVKGLMRDQYVNEATLNDFTTAKLGFEVPRDGLDHLTKGQASAIIEAMTMTPVQRVKQTPPDDPFYDIPVTGPDGEVLT